jgi:hypothetical protein
LTVAEANGKAQGTVYKRAFAPALVKFSQSGNSDETKYTATVDTNDSKYSVKNIKLSTSSALTPKETVSF